jgi:mannose-6-phosphate isomerase-like protein (cupin superfamily)
MASFEQHLADYLQGGDKAALRATSDAGLDALPVLLPRLLRDQTIVELERVEDVLKVILSTLFRGRVDSAVARDVALFQKSLGFLLKYKSYAVKATTPLGYSIFLQTPGEGFSFQRHLDHKVEVFHILGATPGSFVFLSSHEEWEASYESGAFSRWLGGEPNPRFDKFKYLAAPGDVFPVMDLGTVHTVIGCVIEEFASVSVDMVARLHDQNIGRSIPAHFTRKYTLEQIGAIRVAPDSRLATDRKGKQVLTGRPVRGGTETVLIDSCLRAARYHFHACDATLPLYDAVCASLLHVFSGRGELVLADDRSSQRLPVSDGDLVMIPPGIAHHFKADDAITCSEHRISPADSFVHL